MTHELRTSMLSYADYIGHIVRGKTPDGRPIKRINFIMPMALEGAGITVRNDAAELVGELLWRAGSVDEIGRVYLRPGSILVLCEDTTPILQFEQKGAVVLICPPTH